MAIASLALPATTSAKPMSQEALSNYYGWGETFPAAQQDLRSPDAADAARAGEIARAMQRYEAASAGDSTPWPDIAFAGVVLLASAGGLVRLRVLRARRRA
jgi:hypothetical protein